MREDTGFKIYHQDTPEDYFIFDTKLNRGHIDISESIQTSRQILQTFGRVPMVYYAGNTNFKSFDLSNTFINKYDCVLQEEITPKQQLDSFIALVDQRKPLVVETPIGNKYFCDIAIKSIVYPNIYEENSFDFITINISCTEIGSDKVGSF